MACKLNSPTANASPNYDVSSFPVRYTLVHGSLYLNSQLPPLTLISGEEETMQLIKLINRALLLISLLFPSIALTADIDQGKQKASICKGCHGPNGVSSNPQRPNLAGQNAAYIRAQLRAFKSGTRKNSTMQSMAASLSKDDISSLAEYFSTLKAGSAGGDPKLATQGKSKFIMCSGCHGATGKGNSHFPALAGQHPEYLIKQLKNFKAGKREGGPMPTMAKSMSDDDINKIAAYLGSL